MSLSLCNMLDVLILLQALSYEYEKSPKLTVMFQDLRILSVSLNLSSEQEHVFLLKLLESCPDLHKFVLSVPNTSFLIHIRTLSSQVSSCGLSLTHLPSVLGCWNRQWQWFAPFHWSQGYAGEYILPDYQLGALQVSWVQASRISRGTGRLSANRSKATEEGGVGVRQERISCCEADSVS